MNGEDGEMYRCKFSEQNKVLWDLVKPDDGDWEFSFTTMDDFDIVFRKLTSVPNWKQDREIVYLFNTLLQRKHSFFNESYFEEDLIIVPLKLSQSFRWWSNTKGISEQQRKLALLVEDLKYSAYSKHVKEAYEEVNQQFNEIEGWELSQFLVRLHKELKQFESYNLKQTDPQIEQEKNERKRKKTETWVKEHKQHFEGYVSGRYSMSELQGKINLRDIRHCENWRHNKTLWKWNGVLATKLRILQLKQKGTSWRSRIVHEQSEKSEKPKGLLQRIWNKIRPSKKNEKPASQN